MKVHFVIFSAVLILPSVLAASIPGNEDDKPYLRKARSPDPHFSCRTCGVPAQFPPYPPPPPFQRFGHPPPPPPPVPFGGQNGFPGRQGEGGRSRSQAKAGVAAGRPNLPNTNLQTAPAAGRNGAQVNAVANADATVGGGRGGASSSASASASASSVSTTNNKFCLLCRN